MMRHLANAHSVTGPAGSFTGRLFLTFGGTIVHWIGCINAIKYLVQNNPPLVYRSNLSMWKNFPTPKVYNCQHV